MHLPSTWLVSLVAASTALAAAPTTLSILPDDQVTLVKAEKVIVRPGKTLENASVLIVNGRITAVGTDLEAPEGAEVLEGKVVCAGFLDVWSNLGVDGESVADSRTKPHCRTIDALDPYSSGFGREEARASGVLAVRAQVGSGAAFGGFGAWLSTGTSDGDLPVLLDDACQSATVGVSTGSIDVFDRVSQADKVVDEIRSGLDYGFDWMKYREELAAWEAAIATAEAKLTKDFKKAKKDRDKEVEEAGKEGKEFNEKKYKEDKKPSAPKFDAEKAAMERVANGEIPMVVTIHRSAELRALLDGTKQFDRLRLVIAGGTETLGFAEELAGRRIPVIVHPAPLGASRPAHLRDHDLSLAAQLAEKDVSVLIGSGGGSASRDLPLLASLAIGHGLDAEEAFAALTTRAARTFDVADQVGSVQKGRRGDLLILDGEPLAHSTSITHVLVGGQVVSPAKGGN